MSDNKKNKPIWSKEQIIRLEKYLKSNKGQRTMNKALKQGEIEGEKIRKSMEFTWDEWVKIKDVPYTI